MSEPAAAQGKVRQYWLRASSSAWFLPSAFMTAAGAFIISRPVMWQDELVTLDIASRSAPQIFQLLKSVDAVHGTYYLFMHLWIMIFGDSPVAVRLPSLLAMVGAVALTALVAEHLFGRWAGLLAGFMLAIVPSVSRFAQEARSNAFVVLVIVLSMWLLLRALQNPGWATWGLYGLAVTLSVLFNAVSLASVVGQGIGVLFLRGVVTWRNFAWFAGSVVAGLLLASPVIMLGMGQSTRQIKWILDKPPLQVWQQVFASTAIAWIVVGLALLAWFVSWRSAGFATAVGLLPLVVIWAVSQGDLNYFYPRYLVFVLPAWAVLAGAGLSVLRSKPTSIAVLLAITLVSAPAQKDVRSRLSHSWYTYPDAREAWALDYSTAAKTIASGYQPGDAVAYGRKWWWFGQDVAIPYYLPDDIQLRDVFLAQTGAAVGDLWAVECTQIETCWFPENRIWVVTPVETDTPFDWFSDAQRVVLADFEIKLLQKMSGMTVALAERKVKVSAG